MGMEWDVILSLIFFAFTAGAIDAAVGGGGLIQIPGIMSTFPNMSTATVIGTNKVSSIFGTASAAYTFAKKVKLQWKLLAVIAICALISSFAGAACLSLIPQSVLRPFVFVMLIVIAIYTFMKKQFGQLHVDQHITPKLLFFAALGSLAIGFYDGIFGPGTGTFLIFLLVGLVGYAFIKASATAKIVNIATNFGAIVSFQFTGHIWWKLGLALAVANIAGGITGSHLAINGGSKFVRRFFLLVSVLLIAKLGYDWLHN